MADSELVLAKKWINRKAPGWGFSSGFAGECLDESV
jgi:hypothetical protein